MFGGRWAICSRLMDRAQGVVVVGNFQRGETIVADGAGLVSPGPSAFPAPQFVVRHVATRFLVRNSKAASS